MHETHYDSMQAAAVLNEIRGRGVRLWAENGQLRYQAPKGALTSREIEQLKVLKGQIVALLAGHRASAAEASRVAYLRGNRAPLAFSQLAHWNLYRLSDRPAIRQLASATRMRGRLDIRALNRSLEALVRQHTALRTRIEVRDAVPEQVIDDEGPTELRIVDFSALSAERCEQELQLRIETLILQPVDVRNGPLFEAQLFRMSAAEHVLVVVMEHLISDAVSVSILLRDLFKGYEQAANGHAISLPIVRVQFTDYAHRQAQERDRWFAEHGSYWTERFEGCERLRFPACACGPSVGWGSVPVFIPRELKQALMSWARAQHTTLVMSVFTAYAALVMRWCGVSDGVIRIQIDGRTSGSLENTIGYLASILCLRAELLDTDTFADLMRRLRDEYCRAYEHSDASHLDSRVPRPDYTRSSWFNWVPQGAPASFRTGRAGELTCSPATFSHPMRKQLVRDNEPLVLLYDGDEGITGGVQYPLDRFSSAGMERFARHLLELLQMMIARPGARLKDIPLA